MSVEKRQTSPVERGTVLAVASLMGRFNPVKTSGTVEQDSDDLSGITSELVDGFNDGRSEVVDDQKGE